MLNSDYIAINQNWIHYRGQCNTLYAFIPCTPPPSPPPPPQSPPSTKLNYATDLVRFVNSLEIVADYHGHVNGIFHNLNSFLALSSSNMIVQHFRRKKNVSFATIYASASTQSIYPSGKKMQRTSWC